MNSQSSYPGTTRNAEFIASGGFDIIQRLGVCLADDRLQFAHADDSAFTDGHDPVEIVIIFSVFKDGLERFQVRKADFIPAALGEVLSEFPQKVLEQFVFFAVMQVERGTPKVGFVGDVLDAQVVVAPVEQGVEGIPQGFAGSLNSAVVFSCHHTPL